MKDYEIVSTYLNGCSGAAHPETSFEEIALESPEDYLRMKHGKDHRKFVKELRPDGQPVYIYNTGAVCYIYEFNEL